MKNRILLFALILTTLISCKKEEYPKLKNGIYAKISTNKGDIMCQLEFEKTPVTVANYIALAEGKNTFVAAEYKGKKLYDGLKFHRVIPQFMVQGGDPLENGSGDAGYKFKDEFTDLKHDVPGIMSMANSGPGTNGSQFFITHLATPWLDGKHTVFGHVVEGMDVVNKIVQDDFIKSVQIIRKGTAAEKFDAPKVFSDSFAKEAETKKANDEKYKVVKDQKVATLNAIRATATKTASGLQYKITSKGTGKKPANGTNVYIHYAGFLENGELFDSSLEEVNKIYGKFDPNRAAQNGYMPIPFQYGSKDGMISGFIEGLENMSFGDKATIFIPSNLGYGAQGAGGVIPPNANIIFEVELLEKQN